MSEPTIAVIIPTVRRPDALERCLDAVAGQTRSAHQVLVCPPVTVEPPHEVLHRHPEVTLVPGPPGAAAQRNAGIARLAPEVDVVVLLDDDSVPRRDHLEQVAKVFASRPDVVAISGRVVRDGAAEHVELTPAQIEEALAASFAEPAGSQPVSHELRELYGCNTAVRREALEGTLFDERLPLYSAFEDLDLARRLLAEGHGRIVSAPNVVVVHQGHKSGGRAQHLRYGYSSVMNLEYLRRKGSIDRADVLRHVVRSVLSNGARSVRGTDVDWRRSRLQGQALAAADLLRGRVTPERIMHLSA